MRIPNIENELGTTTQVTTDLLSEIKDMSNYCSNKYDKGKNYRKIGSSLLIRRNGDINMSPSLLSQFKTTSDGHNAGQSIEDDTICVRKRMTLDEIVINGHKLNNTLYDYTDFKQFYNSKYNAIGALTLYGTVLVKSWEPTLKKWVLIRRKIRTPIFSPVINIADAPEELSVNSDISQELMHHNESKESDIEND